MSFKEMFFLFIECTKGNPFTLIHVSPSEPPYRKLSSWLTLDNARVHAHSINGASGSFSAANAKNLRRGTICLKWR